MNTSPYFFPCSLFPLADSLSSGILLHRGGRILFANKAMSRLTGFSPDELSEKDFWAFFPSSVSGTICNQGREQPARRAPDGTLRNRHRHQAR